jgi:serine/threonine-protein kinase Chk2
VAPEILENTRHRKYTRAVDVWSLGVVLYICLCGFPPFSDELYSREHPYSLAQQIKMGRFDYPSPYWDHIGDPALDLIDRMLTVNIDKRITIDECLEHPWTLNAGYINPADSTDGLVGELGKLDFSKRKMHRERTLLSSINDVKVSKVIQTGGPTQNGPPGNQGEGAHVKVWEKNPDGKNVISGAKAKGKGGKAKATTKSARKEEHPAAHRDMAEFMEMGGKGDMQLFGDDVSSRYLKAEIPNDGGDT